MASATWTRPLGTPAWDAVLRGTAIVAALAAGASLVWDDAARLATFALITIWVHGPVSPLLPAAYEPTLLFMGQLYPPLVVAAIGTACVMWIEGIDYVLLRRLGQTRHGRGVVAHPLMARAVRLFDRRPFFTIWLFAWSPLPFWMMRILAPAARYPVPRYLAATALGRLPRFLFLAALGARLAVPPALLAAIVIAGTTLSVLVLLLPRMRRARPSDSSPALPPLPPEPEAA